MEFPDNGGMFSTDVSAQINQSEQFKLPDMTGTKAILYLIPPKEVIPQYRRSINYRFGSNDIRRIENYLDKANTLGGITPKDSKLGGNCAECVLPSADAEPAWPVLCSAPLHSLFPRLFQLIILYQPPVLKNPDADILFF